MTIDAALRALAGGALIGLASAIVLLVHGRIAGISGIVGRAVDPDARTFRLPFLAGLVATGVIAAQVSPQAIGESLRGAGVLALAGVLVGVGTTLGNGCTSGHGVCGIGRFSKRSIVAVLVFMVTAAITVALAGARA